MRAKKQSGYRFLLKNYVFLCISKRKGLKGMVPDQHSSNSFAVFGGNVSKCNEFSKLLSVFLGPLV
jgi:hypothetical protein